MGDGVLLLGCKPNELISCAARNPPLAPKRACAAQQPHEETANWAHPQTNWSYRSRWLSLGQPWSETSLSNRSGAHPFPPHYLLDAEHAQRLRVPLPFWEYACSLLAGSRESLASHREEPGRGL